MFYDKIPTGFISVEDAIKLIESDTNTNAKVDADFLFNNLPFLRVDGNYTIKKVKHVKGRVVEDGEAFVHIDSDYHRAMLEHCIVEHFKQYSNRYIDPEQIGIKRLSTTVDDEKNPGGRIVKNRNSKTKVGDEIISGVVQNVEE
mgnify:CR=1 FL=1